MKACMPLTLFKRSNTFTPADPDEPSWLETEKAMHCKFGIHQA